MNEFGVIGRISALLPPAPPEVLVPVGDDCAVFRSGGATWAAASDMLVAGRHFKGYATPEDVGFKAVAVNVSDVAAMGGTPRFVLTSGATPDPETGLRLFRGVLEACEAFGVYPLGGDTTSSGTLTVDVAILGELEHPPVLRSGARPGDLLAVTGELGASAAGFLALDGGIEGFSRLKRRHLRPEPRTAVGREAARLGVGAMIDLSDGLASDVRHVCEKSGAGCRIDLDLLPVAEDTRDLAATLDRDPGILAATGGEDYELLIAAPEHRLNALAEAVAGAVAGAAPLAVIGEVTTAGVVFQRGDATLDDLSGWDHFG